MSKFKELISVAYPPGNKPIFEEWLSENYNGCNTDRELIPVWFTSWWVNHNYGNDLAAKQELQNFIDSLDRNKKYWTCVQYDDSVLIDFKDLDVLRFEMSKPIGIGLPLLCQPHPYKFISEKKWLASFVGSRTHPIRDELEKFKNSPDYFISYERIDIDTYCRILHESIFALCPRGYGSNSFRASEAMQYNVIPVFIGDEFIHPFDLKLYDYGVVIHSKHIEFLEEILDKITPQEIEEKQRKCREIYEQYYTYTGCMDKIIKSLDSEYHNRQSI